MAMQDKVGNRYGMLVVMAHSHSVFRSPRQGSYQYWKCKCDCGKDSVVLSNSLTSGKTKSCGCQSSRLALPKRNTTHGQSIGNVRSRTYNSWRAMKDRCLCKTHIEYKRYGALGVTVCDSWKDNFQAFFDDMGERPDGMSLDRIDPYGNYEPSNCRWADAKTQSNNTRARSS